MAGIRGNNIDAEACEKGQRLIKGKCIKENIMNRERMMQELQERNITFSKIKFYKKSPYQQRRYKPEYVGWEVWIYNSNMPVGYVITQEDYEDNKELVFEGLEK